MASKYTNFHAVFKDTADAIRAQLGYTSNQFPIKGKDIAQVISELPCGPYDSSYVDPAVFLGGTISYAEGSATSIPAYAFCKCSELSIASFPNCSYISSYAFSGCSNLQTISFSKLASVANAAFQNCINLTIAYLPNCTYVSPSAFTNCAKLTWSNIHLASNLTYIANSAFYGINKSGIANDLNILSFPECARIEGSAFDANTTFSYINLPKCTTIGDIAKNTPENIAAEIYPHNSTLLSLNLPEAEYIYAAFISYQALKTASLPKATQLAGTFSDCISLSTIFAPNIAGIGNYTFNNCYNISMLSFPNCTYIGTAAFENCNNLEEITIPKCDNLVYNNTFNNCTKLKSLFFEYCSRIGGKSIFYNCQKLSTLTLFRKCDFSTTDISITEIFDGSPFTNDYGSGYASIYVPEGFLSYYTGNSALSIISSRFVTLGTSYNEQYIFPEEFYFSSITSFPSDRQNVKMIYDRAFASCYSLSGGISLSNCTKICNEAFNCCSNLTSLYLGTQESLYIGKAAFARTGISYAYLPDSLIALDEQTFYSCSNLNNIRIPSSLTNIPQSCFKYCNSLSSFNFNYIKTIEEDAFALAFNKGVITLPVCEKINSDAFYSASIAKVWINTPELGQNAFERCQITTLYAVDLIPGKMYYSESAYLQFASCLSLSSIYIYNASQVAPLFKALPPYSIFGYGSLVGNCCPIVCSDKRNYGKIYVRNSILSQYLKLGNDWTSIYSHFIGLTDEQMENIFADFLTN